jgi:hypothetical protein
MLKFSKKIEISQRFYVLGREMKHLSEYYMSQNENFQN